MGSPIQVQLFCVGNMAVSICGSRVRCNQWIKIGNYYYSVCSMPYSSFRNNSTVFDVFSKTQVHLGKNYQISKLCSAVNRRNMCVYRCIVGYYKQRTCINTKNIQSSNFDRHVKFIDCLTRWYSDNSGSPKRILPNLMEFPEIVWPSVIKTLRNWILSNLIITPYFDQDFRLSDFISGSKQAVEYVSGCLSNGDYTSLDNLMTSEALQEVKKNISTFSLQQRQELAISKEDIYFSFPYQIGIMFSDDDKNQQRFVEITMCYHVLRGLKELLQQGVTPPLNMGMLPEYRHKIFICNYRFIREFTKGVEDQWTINIINHFKPADYAS